jgi:tetratricopeptide (TPR) repeat protein
VQQLTAAAQKLCDGRVDVIMNSSRGKAKESVRIKPENLRLYSRKMASDCAVHPGIRCVIRHHSIYHHRLVVEVVSHDPRNESVAVRAVSRIPSEAPFVVMAHNLVPLSLHLLARKTFASVLKLIPELRQLDTDLGAAVIASLKSCGLFLARCCRSDLTTDTIKLSLQNFYASYIFEMHALTKARKYDWYFEYSLVAVNVVTGYMEQHQYHLPGYDVHTLCKATFEERNMNSMNLAMSYMNIGVMCCKMNRLDEAHSNLLKAQNFLNERGFFETLEASKVAWCLGVCYSMQKSKWALGEKLLKDSLRMKLKRAGRAALEVTLPLDSLILLYFKQNRLKEAEILCREMWRLRESALSPHTNQYSEALFRIAQLYERRDLLHQSESVCKEVLRLREAFFGWESLAVAETLNLIALLRARTMLLDESELLLKEVLRIAPMFSSSFGSCNSGGGGIPGSEVFNAIALIAHINFLRGNNDLALRLHEEALELQASVYESSGHPLEPCCSNLGNVWCQSSFEVADRANAPLSVKAPAVRKSVWTYPSIGEESSDPLHAVLFLLPDGCAPEVLAKWVVHSDLLEAKGYKRRVYDPENAAAAVWAAAALGAQHKESFQPVAEDVVEFFIDRAVQRGQLRLPADCTAETEKDPAPATDPEVPAESISTGPLSNCENEDDHGSDLVFHRAAESSVPNCIYQDFMRSGDGDFLNLYADARQGPASTTGAH